MIEIYFTTQHEQQFLDALGTHAPKMRATSPLTVEELFENYIKSAKRRAVWGHISSEAVISHAKELLARARVDSEINPYLQTR